LLPPEGSLLAYLLKRRRQPELQCGSWRRSIREARDQIGNVLDDNTSLKAYPTERLPKTYARARLKALDETGLLRLPELCPWTIEEILDGDLLP
jgi:hypothetical protein